MPIYNNESEKLNVNACIENFMKEVNQELSVACMLPHSLPKKELMRIINQAKKWFYKNYEYSLEEKYLALSSEIWRTPEFKKNSELKLIDDVMSVTAVWQIGRDSGEASLRGLFNNNAGINNIPGYGIVNNDHGGRISLSSDRLVHYVLSEKFYDLTRMVTINKMSYDFNYLNNTFRFLGAPPIYTVILQVYTKIDDCSLFKEEIFFRYVVATAKVQLSRVLGTFNYNLPGNITINYDLIRSEGQDELAAIKEEIKSDEGTDYFFTS